MNSKNAQSIDHVEGTCSNVTLLLSEAETKYQRLYQNMFDAIIVYDYEQEKVLDCNESAVKLLGYTKAELLDLNRFNMMPAESKYYPGVDIHEEIRANHRKMVFKGETIFSLGELITKEGVRISAKINVIPIAENSYHGFVVIQDISKGLEQNKLLQEKERKMDRLFNQQKQILDAIPAPFLFKDLENNIITCNKALAKTRDLEDPKDLIGKNLKELITKEEAERALKSDMEIVRTEEPIRGQIYSVRDLDGNNRWYRNDKTPYRDQKGHITGILSFVVDVSELIEKNERLKQYIESNKQLNNFAAIASHDLQAPLRTIHSFTQLLERRLKDRLKEEEKEYMQFIISATGNMRHLIRDLRTYSQVDSAELNINKFCLDRMINEIYSELKSTIDFKKALIQIPESMPTIIGDRIKLKQLFQNLITNALKYVAKDVAPEIHLSFKEQSAYWYFEIKDNGIGIAPEYQNKIFELFKRLHKGNDEYQGTGIGLSLCKKVVDQHQGTIGVRSASEEGSTFYFTIAKEIATVEDLIGDS